ncbi:MAG: putative quinol monooxygenase [bacterium]
MLAVIAKIRIREGKMDTVMKVLNEFLPHVAKEPGTLFYTFNRDPANPNLLVVLERYRDQAAFQAHATSPHMAEFMAKVQTFVEAPPELSILEEVASI